MTGVINALGAFLMGLAGGINHATLSPGTSDILSGLNVMIAGPLAAVFNTTFGIGSVINATGAWLAAVGTPLGTGLVNSLLTLL